MFQVNLGKDTPYLARVEAIDPVDYICTLGLCFLSKHQAVTFSAAWSGASDHVIYAKRA